MSDVLTKPEAFEVRAPLPKPLYMGANVLVDREYTGLSARTTTKAISAQRMACRATCR